MKYLVKETNGVHVTWFAQINRYILFREPAFRVFRLWVDNKPEQEIIAEIGKKYHLPLSEARRFTNEITSRIRDAIAESRVKEEPAMQPGSQSSPLLQPIERVYAINGSTIRLHYGNNYIESAIHPRIQHLSARPGKTDIGHSFDLTCSGGFYHLETSHPVSVKSSFARIEELAGAVYLQLLNIMYGTAPDDWMGVAHASAVTDGTGAVIFVAPSGGGKSTIAALMMANGFKLLSDDFVPIALTKPEIYRFPAGLSVKNSALPFLREYFPSLADKNNDHPEESSRNGIYIPLPEENLNLKSAETKAIIFVHYDKSTDYQMTNESNLEKMNDFLKQSWIANNPEAAGRFMDWYFDLPVYSLRYSNNEKAITGIQQLFQDESPTAMDLQPRAE